MLLEIGKNLAGLLKFLLVVVTMGVCIIFVPSLMGSVLIIGAVIAFLIIACAFS